MTVVSLDKFAAEGPLPLMREIPEGEAYPIEALGPLREVAEAVHDITQAPPALGAQSALAVASLAAQSLADVECLSGPTPTSLFALSIAQSGERKSSSDKLLMRPVDEYQQELAAGYRDDFAGYKNRLDIWEAQRKTALAKAKGDPVGAEADLCALGSEPQPPLSPVVVATDPTLEGLIRNMANSRPAMGILSNEGGQFLGGHGLNSDNRQKTLAGLSALWDGAAINRTRAGDGASTFYGRRLCCHLMAQPVVASELLGDPLANGQGFLGRFLLTEPPSTIGTRTRHGHAPDSDLALDRFSSRIGELLRTAPPLREGTRNELQPPVLSLEPEAKALLQAFFDQVERAQAPGADLERMRPFASKAAEHAARIAGVMTIYGSGVGSVSATTMADAVQLATFYIGEAQRLSDMAVISLDTAEAEKLRNWLISSWSEPYISVTDVLQYGPASMREASKARKHLAMLEAHHWVTPVDGGAVIKGKQRRDAWKVSRAA